MARQQRLRVLCDPVVLLFYFFINLWVCLDVSMCMSLSVHAQYCYAFGGGGHQHTFFLGVGPRDSGSSVSSSYLAARETGSQTCIKELGFMRSGDLNSSLHA